MEKEICKKKCKSVSADDLRAHGMSEESVKYFEEYGYEIWEPIEKDKYIYVFEPTDKDYCFAMEFLSYAGMDEAFKIWKEVK